MPIGGQVCVPIDSRLQIASQQHVTGVGEYPGIGGRIKSERVGASNRNRWADHPGIRSLFQLRLTLSVETALARHRKAQETAGAKLQTVVALWDVTAQGTIVLQCLLSAN